MRNCISEREFNRYLEDSLSPSSFKELEEHTRICDACRKRFEVWKDLKDKLNDASDILIPDNFKAKVMTRIESENIRPVPAGGHVRRGAAMVFVSLIALYYVFKPLFGPLIDNLFKDLFKAMSVNLYAIIEMMGIDPSVLLKLFGNIMAQINTLFPVFAVSTILMIAAFLIIIIKGKISINPVEK